jgi:hypothetical protein
MGESSTQTDQALVGGGVLFEEVQVLVHDLLLCVFRLPHLPLRLPCTPRGVRHTLIHTSHKPHGTSAATGGIWRHIRRHMGNEGLPRRGHQKRGSKTNPPWGRGGRGAPPPPPPPRPPPPPPGRGGGGGGGQTWSRAWRSLSSASALSLALVASAFPKKSQSQFPSYTKPPYRVLFQNVGMPPPRGE